MIIDVPEPTLGSLHSRHRAQALPTRPRHPLSTLGQDTEEILRELLQMSPSEIEQLRREGAINAL